MLPYFKKAENQERGASECHGVGGPLNVADLRYINPLSRAFVEAGIENGLPCNNDFNGQEQEGVGIFQVTQKLGKRHSAATAYLKPVLNRPNLTVRTHAHVTQLFIEKTRAVGITYVQEGKPDQVSANKEVILCGGTINSPQLLMLSGIGPADHLKALGISVIMDLPGVGENLQDHLLVGVVHECTQPITLASAKRIKSFLNYLFFKKGMLTSNVAEAGGFTKTEPDLLTPDIQFMFGPVYYMSHGLANRQGHGFSIGSTHLRPESRGNITLHSSDPFDPPMIQPNYCARESDLKALVKGVRLSRKLARAKAFDPFRGGEVWPGSHAESDEALCEHIRNTAETCYHPVGTCRMGNDQMAVVDARLRVYGIKALRVVDASVMPRIVSGNPNAATFMIAEKAADLIRGDNKVASDH